MKNRSFLVDLTGEFGSYPVAREIPVNVGVWVFSTVLWVILSNQEVAFFLLLVSLLLWHSVFQWHYTKSTLGGARAATALLVHVFHLGLVMAWCRAGRNSDRTVFCQIAYNSSIVEWIPKQGWVWCQMASIKLSFKYFVTVS